MQWGHPLYPLGGGVVWDGQEGRSSDSIRTHGVSASPGIRRDTQVLQELSHLILRHTDIHDIISTGQVCMYAQTLTTLITGRKTQTQKIEVLCIFLFASESPIDRSCMHRQCTHPEGVHVKTYPLSPIRLEARSQVEWSMRSQCRSCRHQTRMILDMDDIRHG